MSVSIIAKKEAKLRDLFEARYPDIIHCETSFQIIPKFVIAQYLWFTL